MAHDGADGGGERRNARRFGITLQVRQVGHRQVDRASDVSLGGLFLRTGEPQREGGCVPLRLVHPMTGEIIPAVCQVVHQVYSERGEFLGGRRFRGDVLDEHQFEGHARLRRAGRGWCVVLLMNLLVERRGESGRGLPQSKTLPRWR